MYEIWIHEEDKKGFLFYNLTDEEKKSMRDDGFNLEKTIETEDHEIAKRGFIEWCNKQCPGKMYDLGIFQFVVQNGDDNG